MWTEAQLGTLTQRFPLITDNKRLLRADGARDLSDYHYVDFKRTAGILSFPVGLASMVVVCVCVCMFGSVCVCVDVYRCCSKSANTLGLFRTTIVYYSWELHHLNGKQSFSCEKHTS